MIGNPRDLARLSDDRVFDEFEYLDRCKEARMSPINRSRAILPAPGPVAVTGKSARLCTWCRTPMKETFKRGPDGESVWTGAAGCPKCDTPDTSDAWPCGTTNRFGYRPEADEVAA